MENDCSSANHISYNGTKVGSKAGGSYKLFSDGFYALQDQNDTYTPSTADVTINIYSTPA